MVIVEIVSGPRVGQQNLVPMEPKDLVVPAREGWRWRVVWVTVSEEELFDWVKHDLVNKIASALVRGGFVRLVFPEGVHEWNGPMTKKKMDEIDDTIGYCGYNVFVSSDEDDGVTIMAHSRESRNQ